MFAIDKYHLQSFQLFFSFYFETNNVYHYSSLNRENKVWQPDPDPIGGYLDKCSISNPFVLGNCVYFYSQRSSSLWKLEFPAFAWRRAHTLLKLDAGATLSLRCVAAENKAALLVLIENDETVLSKCELWTFALKQDWYGLSWYFLHERANICFSLFAESA